MCENNYNDDDIKTFITNNLNKDIIKEWYKKHFNNNELTELIDLLCNKTYDIDYIVSHYYPNKNEVISYYLWYFYK
jgi:hypothetical protein